MRVDGMALNPLLRGNPFSQAQKANMAGFAGNSAGRRDSVSISKQGREKMASGNDYLQSLMDQKDALKQRRKDLMVRLSTEPNTEFIKTQIKEVDKSLKAVDQQMTEYMLQKQQEALEKQKEENGSSDKELTKEEAQQKQIETLTEASTSLSTMEDMRRTRLEMKRSAGHVEDSLDGNFSVSYEGNQVSQNSSSATLEKLEAGMANLEHAEKSLLRDAEELTKKASEIAANTTSEEEEGSLERAGEEKTVQAQSETKAEEEKGRQEGQEKTDEEETA